MRIRKPALRWPRPRAMLRGLGSLLLGFTLLTVVQVGLLAVIDPPVTLTMLGAMRVHHEKTGQWRLPVKQTLSIEQMGDTVARAVVSSEDARFFLHSGFDVQGICAAVDRNREEGRTVSGGSTITQQVARNAFLWQKRSWLRKGLEAWYALWLELLLSKRRILEVYLNIAETGTLTFGMEAAAERYYGVRAQDLTAEQAARIAAVLPSPRKRGVDGKAASRRAAWILRNPAPFPGDPGFEQARREWAESDRWGRCFGEDERVSGG